MHKKHVAIRTCVACRTSGDKRGLLRVVRRPEGGVVMDASLKANGRGAYVCATEQCINLARKQKKLDRSLKVEVPPEVYDQLMTSASAIVE